MATMSELLIGEASWCQLLLGPIIGFTFEAEHGRLELANNIDLGIVRDFGFQASQIVTCVD